MTQLFESFGNEYVSDKAGIEDQIIFRGGQPITLFDIPASGSSGSAAADAGDQLQQLLADLTGGTSGLDI